MKKLFITLYCFASFTMALSQKAQRYHEKGLEKMKSGKLNDAIAFLDKSIALQPGDYSAWYDRAEAKVMLKKYNESLTDFTQSIKLNPNYKYSYVSRGFAKRNLLDYNGAMDDYNFCLKLDSSYGVAFLNRGFLFEKLGKQDSACADYKKALENGITQALRKVDICNGITAGSTKTTEFITLDEEGKWTKLVAMKPQLTTVNNSTRLMIVFFLILAPSDSSGEKDYHMAIQEDANCLIELKLKNGYVITIPKSGHNNDTSNGQPLMFAAFLKDADKALMKENDIDKITFKTASDLYEYFIKPENAGKLKPYM